MDELKYYNTREEYEEDLNTLYLSDPTVAYIKEEDEVVYVPHNPQRDYFTTVALEDDTVFYCRLSWLTTDQGSPFSQLSYSLDGGETWTTTSLGNGIQITTPVVNTGDEILWKGIGKVIDGTYHPNSGSTSMRDSYFYAKSSSDSSITYKNYSIKGNAMSLLYGDEFSDKFSLPDTVGGTTYPHYEGSSCFKFGGKLISARDFILPATTLKKECYYQMFYGCSSLIETPNLPATTLADSCYRDMFRGCTSLTKAPELPATTLEYGCYMSMFYGCTNLTTVPTTLPATTLANYCYNNMFYGCTSLSVAPELPATTLAQNCYNSMFYSCTSLTKAPELPATTLDTYCYESMFYGCTSLIQAPELLATTLKQRSYYRMFYNCSNLNYIKMLATDISATYCLMNWVQGVAATGTFVKSSDATWTTTGSSGVPSGWTVETYSPSE